MLHEYLGYYYNYGDIAGGGLYVLEEPGRSLRLRDLLADRLGRGTCTTPALSYDGRTVYFAFAPVREGPRPFPPLHHWVGMLPAGRVPEPFNYYSPARACFHLYAMDADGGRPAAADRRAATTISIPVRCPTDAWRFSRRGAAGSAAATTISSPCPPTPCTSWSPTAATSAPFRCTRPTSGTRRCWPTAGSSTRAGTTSTARRPISTACGRATRTARTPPSSSATTRSRSAPVFSPGRSPARGRSCSWPGRITRWSAARWRCSIRRGRGSIRRPAKTASSRSSG